MAKTMNTNINFGYNSTKTDWVGIEDSSTKTGWTGIEDSGTYPYTGGWWGVIPPYYEACWHRLPCGNCMLTGRPCYYQYNIQKYEITCNTKTEE